PWFSRHSGRAAMCYPSEGDHSHQFRTSGLPEDLPSVPWQAERAANRLHGSVGCWWSLLRGRNAMPYMKRREFITLLGGVSPLRNSRLAVILFAASLIILWGNATMAMTLKSPAFQQNGHIPSKYTCEGEDVSPPLAWEGAPNGAKSLVLIIDDP